MPGSALHLSPSAGRSVSLRFPLLLLLLSPSPVLPADPGAPAPGRWPLSCPRRAPGPCVPGLAPTRLSPPAGPASPFGSRCLGGGRGLRLSVGWGLSADPRGVWLWLGRHRVLFGGKGQTGISGRLWEKGQLLSRPSPVLGPQRSKLIPNNPAVSPAGHFRRKQQAPGEGVLAGSLSPASNFLVPFRIPSPSGEDLPR